MGETTGAFFSYAVEFSTGYLRENPRYQPFSVYEDYPGRAFVTASSCDEYVWELLSAAQERGVRLAPAVMPRKYKIVIYTETAPEVITLDAQLDGAGDEHESAPVAGGGDLNNTTRDNNDTAVGRNDGNSTVDSSSSGVSGGGGDDEGDGANDDRSSDSSSGAVGGRQGEVDDGNGGDGTSRGESSDGGRRSRRRVSATMSEGADVVTRRGLETSTTAASSSVESEAVAKGTVAAATAAGESIAESGGVEGEEDVDADDGWGLKAKVAPASDAAGAAQTDDWEQVVAYYQSLQLCLQERKFSFVTSLKDFAQYFDCLDDVAFISKGPHEYYKVNLTSAKLDHITEPEEIPEVQESKNSFT
ncbi:unnamed protein product [Sphacelaria rigidula]